VRASVLTAAALSAWVFFLENAAFIAAAVFFAAAIAAMLVIYSRVESLDERTRRHEQQLQALQDELENPPQGCD
jgi:high-affinity Fe2+/Pb2+ permease